MGKRLLLIALAALALITILVWSQRRSEPLKISGFIEADEIRLGSRVGGRVQKVHVEEGQRVQAGQVLVELEPFDLHQRRAQAQAELHASEAQQDLAQIRFSRTKALFERSATTREEMDQAAAELRRALAMVEAAKAALEVIQRQIAELNIVAPAAGILEAVELQPGDLVASNAPGLSMLDLGHLWVRAYLPENRLTVQVGRKVSVGVDSFPGQRFAAHVSFVARQAEFTPSNVQTPEERSKQVFRVKVTLDEGQDVLRPGMSADVFLE